MNQPTKATLEKIARLFRKEDRPVSAYTVEQAIWTIERLERELAEAKREQQPPVDVPNVIKDILAGIFR